MGRAILDACAYIDLQRARKHRREPWAVNSYRRPSVSAEQYGRPLLNTLTVMEMARNLDREVDPAKLQTFRQQIVENFEIVGFEFDAACLAGELYAKLERVGQRVGIPDTALAAVALQAGFTLVISNTKHFQRVIDLGYALDIENWREASPIP